MARPYFGKKGDRIKSTGRMGKMVFRKKEVFSVFLNQDPSAHP